MKHIFAVLTATLLLLSLFGGCARTPAGGGGTGTTASSTASTSASTTTATTTVTTTTMATKATTKPVSETKYTQAIFDEGSGYAPTRHTMKAGVWYSEATLNPDGKTPSAEVKALLDSYFTYRCQTFAKAEGMAVTAPAGLSLSEEVRTQEDTQRLAGLKKLRTMWDCHFSGAQILYTVDSISGSSSKPVLRVHEAIYFYNWYDGYTRPETSDLSGYGLRHVIRIADGKIQSDHYNEGRPTGVAIAGRMDDDEYWDYAGKEGNPPDLTDSPVITVDTGNPQYAAGYDPQRVVRYADAWAMARNRKHYKDYHAMGGDCANFTSQCMSYGGLPQNGIWWWKDGRTGSGGYAWKTATGMYNYLVKQAKVGKPIAMIECIDETGRTARYNGKVVDAKTLFYVGSPVFYRWKGGFSKDGEWSHATMCVGVLGDGTPTISCHTEDKYNFKWTYGGTKCNYSCVQLTPEP